MVQGATDPRRSRAETLGAHQHMQPSLFCQTKVPPTKNTGAPHDVLANTCVTLQDLHAGLTGPFSPISRICEKSALSCGI